VYKTFISKTTSFFDVNEFEKKAVKSMKEGLRDLNKDLDNYGFNDL